MFGFIFHCDSILLKLFTDFYSFMRGRDLTAVSPQNWEVLTTYLVWKMKSKDYTMLSGLPSIAASSNFRAIKFVSHFLSSNLGSEFF